MRIRHPAIVYLLYILAAMGVVLVMAVVQLNLILDIPVSRFELRHFLLPALVGVLGGGYIAHLERLHQRQLHLAHGFPGSPPGAGRIDVESPGDERRAGSDNQPDIVSEGNTYLFYICGSIILVFVFATAQMLVALQIPVAEVTALMYAIPLALGLTFGYLIARVRILSLKHMRDIQTIMRKDRQLENEIVERRAIETRLRSSHAELAAANRELDAFSYTVSHDLRAPLRGICGFARVLQEDHADQLDEQGRHCLERICSASTRMGELIDGFMSLSHIRSEQDHYERLDISALAGQVVAELAERDPDRQVDVHIEAGMHAEGDRRLIMALLANLLGNAWKFTGKVPRPRIDVGCQQVGDEPVYFVRDNGVGFDEEQAGKLFTPFQRLHSAAEFEGTGIGLATVRKIVELHGGRVWAEARPGAGACFYFTFTDQSPVGS